MECFAAFKAELHEHASILHMSAVLLLSLPHCTTAAQSPEFQVPQRLSAQAGLAQLDTSANMNEVAPVQVTLLLSLLMSTRVTSEIFLESALEGGPTASSSSEQSVRCLTRSMCG